MQLEIWEQASALNKEQVAPSDAVGGGRLGTLAPYLTRKSGNFMGPDTALAHLQPRFSDPGASKSAAKAHSALLAASSAILICDLWKR
jgi:hypothetical protein